MKRDPVPTKHKPDREKRSPVAIKAGIRRRLANKAIEERELKRTEVRG